jgi:putative SOS response-associated peptidase YedK
MINARAETVTEKPSFRHLVAAHRGVVPMDGYYEWRTIDAPAGRKRPYLCTRVNGAVLATAALWTTWRDPQLQGELVTSCAVITVAANDDVRGIHDRMPVLLDEVGTDRWLHDDTPPLDLLQPAPAGTLSVQRVSYAVTNARTDGAQLTAPVDEDPPETLF